MTATTYVKSVELTRAERELLIRLLEQAADHPAPVPRSGLDSIGHDRRYAKNYIDARTAADLLDRLRRP